MLKVIILLLISFQLKALTLRGVKVLEISPDGKTMILDIGEFGGLKNNILALFFIKRDEKFIRVAKGQAVKVNSNHSIWSINLEESSTLNADQRLLMFDSSYLAYRKKPKIIHKHIIKNSQGKVSPLPAYKERNYQELEEVVSSHSPQEWQINITSHSQWGKSGSKDTVLSQEAIPEINLQALEKEQIVRSLIKEVETLIHPEKKIEYAFKKEKGVHNLYKNYADKEKEYNLVDLNALRRIDRKEAKWSEDMNDQELRAFYIESGLAREVLRRAKNYE